MLLHDPNYYRPSVLILLFYRLCVCTTQCRTSNHVVEMQKLRNIFEFVSMLYLRFVEFYDCSVRRFMISVLNQVFIFIIMSRNIKSFIGILNSQMMISKIFLFSSSLSFSSRCAYTCKFKYFIYIFVSSRILMIFK